MKNTKQKENKELSEWSLGFVEKFRIISNNSAKVLKAFSLDCIFLSCHVCVSRWLHTLKMPEYQGTPCSKPQPLNS